MTTRRPRHPRASRLRGAFCVLWAILALQAATLPAELQQDLLGGSCKMACGLEDRSCCCDRSSWMALGFESVLTGPIEPSQSCSSPCSVLERGQELYRLDLSGGTRADLETSEQRPARTTGPTLRGRSVADLSTLPRPPPVRLL